MRIAQLGGFTVHLSGGTDGKGGGNGPVVILLHGFGAPGNDLVPLADVLNVPTGTRFVFPEGPLTLSFGPRDARAWWLIDMARMAQDQAAGRPRDLSNEIPKGLAPARDTMLTFLKEVEHTFNADPRKTVLGGFSQGAMLTKLSREMVQAGSQGSRREGQADPARHRRSGSQRTGRVRAVLPAAGHRIFAVRRRRCTPILVPQVRQIHRDSFSNLNSAACPELFLSYYFLYPTFRTMGYASPAS